MLNLKAVLFDLDDTLIDWSDFNDDWVAMERRHLRNVTDYIVEQGHAFDDFEGYYNLYRDRIMKAWTSAGETLEAPHIGRLIVECAEALGVPAGALSMEDCMTAYRWDAVPGTRVFPEVPEVLAALHEHGIAIGIVTNAPQPMALRDLELVTHRLMDYFPSCRLSAADVGVLKPHPAIFQRALECVGVDAREAVFVGDDLRADIVGAQRAGMRAVWRRTARNEDDSRPDIQPDDEIHSLDELFPILDGWFPGWREVAIVED